MQDSKIFTKAEIKEIDRRLKGDRSDRTGIFTNRIKPKLIEILRWIKKRKEINQLLKIGVGSKKRKNVKKSLPKK